MDFNITTPSGKGIFSTVVKSNLPDDCMWYFRSRGVQTFSSLYAHNSPCFLITQKMWKLFVENKERTQIMTFPFGDLDGGPIYSPEYIKYRNSTQFAPMGRDFLRAIIICLLSKRETESFNEQDDALAEASFSKENQSPSNCDSESKRCSSPFPGTPSQAQNRVPKTTVIPTIITGKNPDGTPIWTKIRVAPASVVGDVERELEKRKREERARMQTSAANGYEIDSSDD